MDARSKFDKFTERARKVLSLAQEEAKRFQHNYIGTEHLLLGLVREGDGVAAKVLQNLGVELNKVRSAVEFIIGRGDRIVQGEIGLTPRAKKVVELAIDEARRMNHHYIGTEHLLLGLVREGEGIAAGVLESLGVRLEQVRRMTLTVLGQPAEERAQAGLQEAQPVEETLIVPEVSAGEITLSPLQDEEDRTLAPSSGDDDPFDKFTVRARRIFTYAEEEARGFQHNYIGTEHLLLALTREDMGIAAHVLRQLGITFAKASSTLEFIRGRGDSPVSGDIALTPRAKKVIALARDEARRLHHAYVGTEHLLLGLVREGEGIAVGIIESLGINVERVRVQVMLALGVAPVSGRERFDKFTERARKVLTLAQDEAHLFQHNYIGTEHLLLGLVREGEGVACKVLSNRGIELNSLRAAVEKIIGRGDRIVLGEIGLAPRARKSIELAIAEARGLNHHYIGTEHLLLGLIREDEGIAAGMLKSFGLTLEDLRTETIAVLSSSGSWPAQTSAQTAPVEAKAQESLPQQGLQNEEDFTHAPSTGSNDISDIFSLRARRVMDAALEEAQHFQHNYIGTEHLLLGLVREESGSAAQILNNLGVERAQVHRAIEFIIDRGVKHSIPGEIKLTPRSHKVIQLAIEEARTLNDSLIGTEHLLLGLLREGEGIAAGVLESMNVHVQNARNELKKIREHQARA